jgi:hypothetical protein
MTKRSATVVRKDAALLLRSVRGVYRIRAFSVFAGDSLVGLFLCARSFSLRGWGAFAAARRRGDLLLGCFSSGDGASFQRRQTIARALGMPVLMIIAAYGVFAIGGKRAEAEGTSKYAPASIACAEPWRYPRPTRNKDIKARFIRRRRRGAAREGRGVYAAMEADIAYRKQQEQ